MEESVYMLEIRSRSEIVSLENKGRILIVFTFLIGPPTWSHPRRLHSLLLRCRYLLPKFSYISGRSSFDISSLTLYLSRLLGFLSVLKSGSNRLRDFFSFGISDSFGLMGSEPRVEPRSELIDLPVLQKFKLYATHSQKIRPDDPRPTVPTWNLEIGGRANDFLV